MDGLECSEITKLELERTLRVDSEFYAKEALIATDIICHKNHDPLTKLVNVSDGNHAAISEKFIEGGVPYYRGQDARSFFIENTTPICIDQETFELPVMKRSHLRRNDVLLSIVGTIGALSLVYSERKATCSCKLAILRPKEKDDAELLAVFLSSKYGQIQIKRFTRGAVQMGLILEDMDQIVVPEFDDDFKQRVRLAVVTAYEKQEQAVSIYKQAQEIIQKYIKFDANTLTKETVSQKRLSETYRISDRLDAEFYQPKYDQINNTLINFKTTGIPVEYEVLKNSYNDYSDNGNIGVVKTKQLRNEGINLGGIESYITQEAFYQNKLVSLKDGDVVFASMGVGSLGKVSIFNSVDDNLYVTDSTLKIYRAKDNAKIKPEVLVLYLQSGIGQELIYRYVVGSTGIINIYDDDIAKIPVPIIDETMQENIVAKVRESFALRRKSRELLDYARKSVEIAVEQDENVAIEWLTKRGVEM